MNSIEWCTSSGLSKVFPHHPKTSMNCTRLTYEVESTKIGWNIMLNISTFGSISMISYLWTNQFSHKIWWHLLITWRGLDIMVSHFYFRRRKGVGKMDIEGQGYPHMNPRSRVHALIDSSTPTHMRHQGLHHIPIRMVYIIIVLSLTHLFYSSTILCTIVPCINFFCRWIFYTTSIPNSI